MTVASIIEDPSFRIITTLRHVHFNSEDAAALPQTIHDWKGEDSKLLCLHNQRLRAAAEACSWTEVCKLLEDDDMGHGLLDTIEQAVKTRFPEPRRGYIRDIRVRVLVNSSGHTHVETVLMGSERPLGSLGTDSYHELPPSLPLATPLAQSLSPLSKVYVDALPTSVSVFTWHKTTFRQPYDSARSRLGIVHSPPTEAEVLLFNPQQEITEASVSTPYFFRDGGWVTPQSASGGMLSVTKLRSLQGGFCTEALVLLDELRDGEIIWLSNAVRGFFRGQICKNEAGTVG